MKTNLNTDILFKLMPIITKTASEDFKVSHMPLVIQKSDEILGTLEKKVQIHAPNIKYIKLEGLKIYEQLVISAMSGYTLFLSNTVIHLEKCPGISTLVIEYNWSSETEKMTATLDQDNYYPLLERVVCRNLQQYSNRFFQAFSFSAPRLTELYIQFADSRL